MRLHKNLVNSVAQTCKEILSGNRHADKALEYLLKHQPQWGSRDRRFVAEAVYDIVRNYRLYSTLARSEDNFWFITGVWLCLKGEEIPAWPEFTHLNREEIFKHKERLKALPAVYGSYPDWLWQTAAQEMGADAWEREAQAMSRQAEVYLRTNTLKISREKLIAEMAASKTEAVPVGESKEALRLLKRENLFKSVLFKEGYFELQDAGSQQISLFLDPQPGDTVIDACAGAGGKSLHLAAIMKNKGRVISLDVEERKLEELKKRARRAGAFNITAKPIVSNKTIKSLHQKADKLLLDVPCSGLGVLKRNPDTKWKLNPGAIEKVKEIQAQILQDYSTMIKINGSLVYSTCSILPSENRQQVELFLEKNKNYHWVDEKTILPSSGTDGFYMAKLRRTN